MAANKDRIVNELPHFMDLPEPYRDPVRSRFAVLPIPYEGTACYKRGTAGGPAAILDASTQLEWFDEEFHREFHAAGIATLPPVPLADDDPAEQMRCVYEAALPPLREGKFLLSLGG